jgi:hypothetical protein
MQSAKRQAQISALILLSLTLPVAGCASAPVYAAPQSACSSLVPKSLRDDVASVLLPPVTATAGDIWIALDGQTGRLDVANSNKTAAIQIVEGCEKRDAAAVRHLTRRWWEFWK